MDSPSCVEEKLSREILRKFKLATEAEAKEDREIVCEEIFNDVTGSLDENAQAALSVSGKASFYLVLAPYYLKDHTAADTLLFFVKRLWGQPYVAPIYALLLHRWMLLRKDAGGLVQRQKHVGVLVFGARQLFLGDVNSSSAKFEPLFRFFAFEVAMGPDRGHLEQLPPTARSQLLATVASFLPYYCDPKELGELVAAMPSPLGPQQDGKAQGAGEGADFTVAEITDILPEIKVEPGLVRYLQALSGLAGSEQLRGVRARTRIRLQSELYVLSLPGGPRYPPKPVRDAAMATLDSLFPMGRKSRRVVQLLFRLLHPTDWLGEFWLRPVRLATWLYVRCVLVVLRAVVGVPVKVYGAMGRRRG